MLVAGVNSYVTIAEADAYFLGSIQWSAAWAALTDDEKTLALISAFRTLEREKWAGEISAVRQVTAAAVVAAGTGYAVGDVVQLEGGTRTVAARITVLTVGGSGELQTFSLLQTGYYSFDPSSPVSTTAVTGAGTLATFDLTLVDQIMDWPRTITDCGDLEVDPVVIPADIQAAQAELAAIFNSDPSQASNVGAGAAGTGSNIKKVEAGSAKVTYFRPTKGTIYPTVVWQFMNGYRDGACGTAPVGNAAFGTGDVSAFTCPTDRYGLSEGYA